MPTTFTLDACVLEAMLAFTSTNCDLTGHTILQGVLCEVTPESIRLVATNTHVLGLLHLTPLLGHGLDIQCETSLSLVLPIAEFAPVLKNRKLAAFVSIEGEQVTITAATGLSLTLTGHPAEEFPEYARVLALDREITPTARIAYDGALLARFAAFAKVMGQPPHLDLAFHGSLSPASVRIAGLSGFYGILMPRQMAYEVAIPAWLLPPQLPALEERVIRLHDVEGDAKLAGVDEEGVPWLQFEVDELADQEPGVCAICGAELKNGWLCGEGGEEVCDRHIEIVAAGEEDASGNISTSVEEPLPDTEDMPVAIPA